MCRVMCCAQSPPPTPPPFFFAPSLATASCHHGSGLWMAQEHEEQHTLCQGAHDVHCIVCPAAVPEAYSMTNLSLVLLRQESPDNNPGLLEAFFNLMISYLLGLLLTHVCTSMIGYAKLCPDVPVLPGGAVHMRPHQASGPCGYVLWG
jgi:hypothetical protein